MAEDAVESMKSASTKKRQRLSLLEADNLPEISADFPRVVQVLITLFQTPSDTLRKAVASPFAFQETSNTPTTTSGIPLKITVPAFPGASEPRFLRSLRSCRQGRSIGTVWAWV